MQKLDFSVETLTEEHKKEMEKHAGFNQETIVGHYDEVCTNYEAIYLRVGFHDPKKCAELTSECYQLIGKDKADVEVITVGKIKTFNLNEDFLKRLGPSKRR